MSGPSPVVEQIEADPAEGQAQQDVAENTSGTANSSTAETEEGEKSLLASVEEALSSSPDAASPAAEPDPADKAESPSKQGEPDAQAKESPLGELTEEEIGKYGPRTQRRIRQLLHDRSEREAQIAKLTPRAEEFDKIEQFISQNRLSTEDVAQGFRVMALMKSKPHEAWEALKPIVRQLAEVTGNILPADLEDQVSKGYITREHAMALSTARARNTFYDTADQARSREEQQRHQQQAQVDHANACRDSANEWEKLKRASDPEWNEKQSRIGEMLKLHLLEKGYPKSVSEIPALMDGFLDRVNKEFARFVPKPKAVTPIQGGASSRATAEPKTLQEAVDRALAVSSR